MAAPTLPYTEDTRAFMVNYSGLPPLESVDSIRLINLKPGVFGSDISMSIGTYSLLNPPEYSALSYTWGDPLAREYVATKLSRIVWIDTHPFLVTPNLYDALEQWRFSIISVGSGKNLLWIDGICINQDDMSERSRQVGLMGQIYSKAYCVVSWLGQSDLDTSTAIKLILRLQPLIKFWASDQLGAKASLHCEELFKKAGVSSVKKEEWKSLHSFCNRQYFSRAWIVQEIALANQMILMCGHYIIPWVQLINLSEMMVSSNWIPILESQFARQAKTRMRIYGFSAPAKYMHVRRQFEKAKSSQDSLSQEATQRLGSKNSYRLLELLLYETRHFQATDDRDHIYAVLAIVRHVLNASFKSIDILEPDYRLPVNKVFINFTREIVTKTESVPILSLIDHDTKHISDLPSWVPDYSISGLQALAYSCPLKSYWTFGLSRQSPEPTVIEHELFLSAMRWDTITNVTQLGIPSSLRGEINLCLQLPKLYVNGQTRLEAFWRTQIADNDGHHSPAPDWMGKSFRQYIFATIASISCDAQKSLESRMLDMAELHSLYTFVGSHDDCPGSWLPSMEELDSFQKTSRTPEEVGEFISKLIHEAEPFQSANNFIAGGRSLFITLDDLIGLAQKSAKSNDTVWFFPGSKVPFVLRYCGEKQYELIGEAYLHGYMHGELEDVHGPLERISLV